MPESSVAPLPNSPETTFSLAGRPRMPLAVAMARRFASAPSDISITVADDATLMTSSLPRPAIHRHRAWIPAYDGRRLPAYSGLRRAVGPSRRSFVASWDPWATLERRDIGGAEMSGAGCATPDRRRCSHDHGRRRGCSHQTRTCLRPFFGGEFRLTSALARRIRRERRNIEVERCCAMAILTAFATGTTNGLPAALAAVRAAGAVLRSATAQSAASAARAPFSTGPVPDESAAPAGSRVRRACAA